MNRMDVMGKKILSVLLAIVVLLGTISIGTMFASASETTEGTATTTEETWELLAESGDLTWTTTGETYETKTVTLDKETAVTKLQLKINEISGIWNGGQYEIFEIQILDSDGNNVALTSTVSGSEDMTENDTYQLSYVKDGNTSSSWSKYGRVVGNATPENEYFEFEWDKPVKVSKVTMWCNYCNGNAPRNWDIYGITSDVSYAGEKTDIQWASTDSTVESQSILFDTPIYTNKLRLYIDEVNQYYNYDILELEIIGSNGQNIEDNVTITVSDAMTETNLGYLIDDYIEGWSKYGMSDLGTSTPTNQYFDIKLQDIVEVKEVRIWCWYGGTALTAFSVYVSAFNPTAVLIDDEYKLDSTNNIISCVPAGTTALEMLNKLDVISLYGGTADIYDEATKITLTEGLRTGDVLQISKGNCVYEMYTIAVFGDVDGDGQATIADTVYTEKNLDSLTTLQRYAASLNGWNVIGASGAVDWQIGGDVADSRVIEFNIIPENVTSLRVRINVSGLYKNYQIFEIKMYGPDGTNVAKNAKITAADGMPAGKLSLINNENLDSAPFTSNNFSVDKAGLENEYFDFTWSEPVTVCSMELINKWAKSTAPKDFDILYEFGTAEEESSEILVNHAVLEAYQPEEQLYSDEYVQAVAEKVKTHSGLTFAFVTDTHIDANATYGNPSLNHLSNVTRVSNLLSVDAIVHGGDLIDGVYSKYRSLNYITDAVAMLVTESNSPVLMTQGNHDDNSPYLQQVKNTVEQYTTADEWYWTVTRNLEQYNIVQNPNDLNGNYYYVDFESEKVRMLVVNTNDLPYVLNDDGTLKYLSSSGDFAISNEQLNWIASEALDFSEKEDWQLVVISHVSLHNPTESENQPCRNSEILTDMLEAFQSGGSYISPVYTGDFAQSVSVDFTTQGAQDVIACIAGHNHKDLGKEINGIWYITTAASLANTRAYGTTEEDAFDIFTIDTANRKIYATRFGSGEDREFTY